MNLYKNNCWIISDNIVGHENQSICLAEKLQIKYEIKKIKKLNFFKRNLSLFFPSIIFNNISYTSSYPKVIISCGKHTAYFANFLKKKMKKEIVSIFIQKPPIKTRNFDIVISPKHDKCEGKNIIKTNGALTKINKNYVRDINKKKKSPLLKKKFVAVLIGGQSRHHTFTNDVLEEIKKRLLIIVKKYRYNFLIFFSRRTGKKNEYFLRNNLKNKKFIFISNKSKKISYLEAISLAQAIIVSSDSVSMVSEACSTGKSIYLIDIPTKSKKFALFIKNLIDLKLINLFKNTISLKNNNNALNDTEYTVKKIKKKFNFFR